MCQTWLVIFRCGHFWKLHNSFTECLQLFYAKIVLLFPFIIIIIIITCIIFFIKAQTLSYYHKSSHYLIWNNSHDHFAIMVKTAKFPAQTFIHTIPDLAIAAQQTFTPDSIHVCPICVCYFLLRNLFFVGLIFFFWLDFDFMFDDIWICELSHKIMNIYLPQNRILK